MGTDEATPIVPPVTGITVTAYEAHGAWSGYDENEHATTSFDDWSGWPVAVRECADALADDFDNGTCFTCETPIGWVMHDDLVYWRYTSVLTNGDVAWAVCEDCAAVFEAPHKA